MKGGGEEGRGWEGKGMEGEEKEVGSGRRGREE